MAKPGVFVSHISKEGALAALLKKNLSRDFLSLFDIFVSSDGVSIEAGEKWLDEVGTALEQAQIAMVLCSTESVARPWINFEAGAAWIRRIRLIPVCHSGIKPEALPMPLKTLNGVVAGEAAGIQALYRSIAKVLDIDTPAADFAAIAAEVCATEETMRQAAGGIERVAKPRILCVVSEQYGEPGYGTDKDIAVLEQAFPGQVRVEHGVTSVRLGSLLATEKFDIIHLVMAVDPDTGDLLFSPIDYETYRPKSGQLDYMSPDAFADLVVESGARLVNLATCHALFLAAEVARVCNMIATNAQTNGDQVAKWGECFYGFLAKGIPLYKAAELTRKQNQTPLRLIRYEDVAFAAEASAIVIVG
jgi:hypothetical protein